MHHVKISTVFAILVIGVLLGTAVDGMLNVGDTFIGNITVMDTDVVEFEGVAGEKITAKVKSSKGSLLLPLVKIIAPDMSVVAQNFTGNKNAALKKIELPVTGVYQIEVSGTNATIGSYKMTTKSKLSKAITKPKNNSAVGNGMKQDTPFDSKSETKNPADPTGPLKTWLLSGTIKRAKKSDAVPFNPSITGPPGSEGDPIELTGFITKNKKGVFKIKNLVLPDMGTYMITVENSGLSGMINTNLRVKKPKLKKQKVEKEL
jgi:hypothetical protein